MKLALYKYAIIIIIIICFENTWNLGHGRDQGSCMFNLKRGPPDVVDLLCDTQGLTVSLALL